MKKLTDKEIIDGISTILATENEWSCNDPEIEVLGRNPLRVRVSAMYESPPFNTAVVLAFAKMFDTVNIDEDRFSMGGCETCDYGSQYGYTLTIKPGKTLDEIANAS